MEILEINDDYKVWCDMYDSYVSVERQCDFCNRCNFIGDEFVICAMDEV